MVEPVRLVIWDLDETFWRGTLTEGGIKKYVQAHHNIVVELARRGIMSSIVSKNDFGTVRKILEERGIWDYFVFASIDWLPKAPRIAALIESIQLRPATVMFIDDNPHNRGEAQALVPDLQVQDEKFIPKILRSPLFKGKNDRSLSRLKQYKVLEKKNADMAAAGPDNSEFLRSCNVRVEIETDVASHLDRAIELINQTNQLNFTKIRLPENIEDARAMLLDRLKKRWIQAGLVKVIDNYGDHGYCGFYLLAPQANMMMDYCFSRSILGLGVEEWLYTKLGRPKINVVGEVLTDLRKARNVDWITGSFAHQGVTHDPAATIGYREVRLRGDSDLDALGHYFKLDADRVYSETNVVHDHLYVRVETTVQLLPALKGMPSDYIDAGLNLGFRRKDFESTLLSSAPTGSLLIYSPWGDVYKRIYRHKKFGFRFSVSLSADIWQDLTMLTESQLEAEIEQKKVAADQAASIRSVARILREDYISESVTPRQVLQESYEAIFRSVPENSNLIFIAASESLIDDGKLVARPWVRVINEMVGRVASKYPQVSVMKIDDYISGISDFMVSRQADHYSRSVYFRLFEAIKSAQRSSADSKRRLPEESFERAIA